MDWNDYLWRLVYSNLEGELRTALEQADQHLQQELRSHASEHFKKPYFHPHPNNPVHFAAHKNRPEMLKLFFEHGVNVNMEAKYRQTVCHNGHSGGTGTVRSESLLHAAIRGVLHRNDNEWQSVQLIIDKGRDGHGAALLRRTQKIVIAIK